MVEAKWSGSYPCLCSGEWTLLVDGEDVSSKIPKKLRKLPMNTFGSYLSCDVSEEVWEEYQAGLECDEWITKNKAWLDTITKDHSVQSDIFYAFSASDWRPGSCGGCI